MRAIFTSQDPSQRQALQSRLRELHPEARLTADLPLIGGFAAEVPATDRASLQTQLPDAQVFDDSLFQVKPDAPGAERLSSATATLGLERLWRAGITGKGVGIAIVDTGVARHPDLKSRLVAWKDIQHGVPTPNDSVGHGTHVASIAAGQGKRLKGCAPEANLIGVQVCDSDGWTSPSIIIEGLQWAVANRGRYNIRVLNLSLGAPITAGAADDPLAQAVEATTRAGLVTCVAAGNSGPASGTIKSPAHAPSAVTVGALDDKHTPARSDDEIARFSSRGPTKIDGRAKPDLVAPGVDIVAAHKTSGYTSYSGTSMASPMVAGCAALLLQARPELEPAQVKELLTKTASALPGVDALAQGAGLVDPYAALQAADRDQAPVGKPPYRSGEILLKLRAGAEVARLSAGTARRLEVPADFDGELYHVQLRSGETVEKAIERLSGQDGVVFAEPNYLVSLEGTPGGPNDLDHNLWNLRNTGEFGGRPGVDIGALEAWKIETGRPDGQGPAIAVIDTGVDYTHPDLAANMWTNPHPGSLGYPGDVHGANMFKKNGDCMDDNEHGTHAAGTIGAVGNNGVGVVGINWHANIIGIKALSQFGAGDVAHMVNAITYASQAGARITSNSYGAGGYSQALFEAMQASPALHLCAAGNSAQDNDRLPTYPASFQLPNVISVGAHDRSDQMPHFSNYGAHSVHLVAPGATIYSTTPGNTYSQRNGTSFATPHVAGVAGLLAAHFPKITNEQLVSRLLGTVVKAPAYEGKTISGGRLHAGRALAASPPPEAPRGLAVEGLTPGSVTLRWAPPPPAAVRWEARWSPSPDSPQTLLASGPADQTRATGLLTPGEGPSQFEVRFFDSLGQPSEAAAVEAQRAPANLPTRPVEFIGWARDERGIYQDSPQGAYAPHAQSVLVSEPLELPGARPFLKFRERHDLEPDYDFVHVEVSSDEGRSWHEESRLTAAQDWVDRCVDLSAYAGQTVQVRFRLQSDGAQQRDGISLAQPELGFLEGQLDLAPALGSR